MHHFYLNIFPLSFDEDVLTAVHIPSIRQLPSDKKWLKVPFKIPLKKPSCKSNPLDNNY